MGYRAGFRGSEAARKALGLEDVRPYPTLTCDVVGCGYQIEVRGRGAGGNIPPAWLGKGAPRGWKRVQVDDERPQYICPECWKAIKNGPLGPSVI